MPMWKLFAHDLWGLVVPRRCAGCDDALLSFEGRLCMACLEDLPLTRFNDDPLNPVERLFHGKVELAAAGALLRFSAHGMVQHLLHRIKYNEDVEAARELGRLMGRELKACARFAGADAIMAVPLHPRKRRARGYNQSELLCEGIAQVLPLPPLHHLLRRVERTASQTRKSRLARWRNVSEAFEPAEPQALRGRHVLLVDDVMTTGATLEACAKALIAAGARVSVFAAACA
ncbi:MAG: ComF family protein [Flavobacteriales bacterium]